MLAIVPFDDEDEAVRLANDTEYGLVSYAYTENLARGQRLIERLETGMMGLNVGVVSTAAAPFGGWKMSGLGREGGPEDDLLGRALERFDRIGDWDNPRVLGAG